MPTPTYIPLATVTLGSSASSVTFSSIPATYRDLVLVTNARYAVTLTTENIFLTLNSDSGSNYTDVQMVGNGSTATSSTTSTTSLRCTFVSASNKSYFANGVIQVMDYSATDKHKTVLTRADSADDFTVARAGRYASTSAITTMTLTPLTGNLGAGSTFSLYGIAS